ncbi:MAG TPA: diacylglycerol kinase family protein [Thermoleophilia bacterium]|nr:diacylglycerol kinase family protein [Thermoleophilia bacterium]
MTEHTASQGPAPGRRLAAAAAIALFLGVFVATVLVVLDRPLEVVVQVVLLAVVLVAAWNALTRKGAVRGTWIVVAVVAAVAVVVIQIAGSEKHLLSLLVRLALLGVALLLSRYALTRDVRSLKQTETPGKPAPAARRGVLIMNLKSGGGKAEKFHLVDECRARGIEPVVLQRGDDLLQLAHDAIDGGADVIGMAGGDGSQALVASIAAERGVPMVVIPAGTRNHFALDIGLDREDVVGALDAYDEARERVIDLADVNGRIFVNNVSLGLYATIVQSPEYRDAKRETTLAALPEMLGPGSKPFDLRFSTPDGREHDGAHVIQVSNGPYGTTTGGITSRPHLDTGTLGVFSLVVPDAVSATRAIAALTTAHPALYDGYLTWATPTFEVDSGSPIAVGLDGEALDMEPPLVFRSRPGVLRLRLPLRAIGYSPAARATGVRGLLGLWRVVLGRPVGIDG